MACGILISLPKDIIEEHGPRHTLDDVIRPARTAHSHSIAGHLSTKITRPSKPSLLHLHHELETNVTDLDFAMEALPPSTTDGLPASMLRTITVKATPRFGAVLATAASSAINSVSDAAGSGNPSSSAPTTTAIYQAVSTTESTAASGHRSFGGRSSSNSQHYGLDVALALPSASLQPPVAIGRLRRMSATDFSPQASSCRPMGVDSSARGSLPGECILPSSTYVTGARPREFLNAAFTNLAALRASASPLEGTTVGGEARDAAGRGVADAMVRTGRVSMFAVPYSCSDTGPVTGGLWPSVVPTTATTQVPQDFARDPGDGCPTGTAEAVAEWGCDRSSRLTASGPSIDRMLYPSLVTPPKKSVPKEYDEGATAVTDAQQSANSSINDDSSSLAGRGANTFVSGGGALNTSSPLPHLPVQRRPNILLQQLNASLSADGPLSSGSTSSGGGQALRPTPPGLWPTPPIQPSPSPSPSGNSVPSQGSPIMMAGGMSYADGPCSAPPAFSTATRYGGSLLYGTARHLKSPVTAAASTATAAAVAVAVDPPAKSERHTGGTAAGVAALFEMVVPSPDESSASVRFAAVGNCSLMLRNPSVAMLSPISLHQATTRGGDAVADSGRRTSLTFDLGNGAAADVVTGGCGGCQGHMPLGALVKDLERDLCDEMVSPFATAEPPEMLPVSSPPAIRTPQPPPLLPHPSLLLPSMSSSVAGTGTINLPTSSLGLVLPMPGFRRASLSYEDRQSQSPASPSSHSAQLGVVAASSMSLPQPLQPPPSPPPQRLWVSFGPNSVVPSSSNPLAVPQLQRTQPPLIPPLSQLTTQQQQQQPRRRSDISNLLQPSTSSAAAVTVGDTDGVPILQVSASPASASPTSATSPPDSVTTSAHQRFANLSFGIGTGGGGGGDNHRRHLHHSIQFNNSSQAAVQPAISGGSASALGLEAAEAPPLSLLPSRSSTSATSMAPRLSSMSGATNFVAAGRGSGGNGSVHGGLSMSGSVVGDGAGGGRHGGKWVGRSSPGNDRVSRVDISPDEHKDIMARMRSALSFLRRGD